MTQYIARRILVLVPVLLAISLMVFSMLHLAPGDPVLTILGSSERANLSPEMIAAVRAQYGLDQPVHIQYLQYIGRAIRGDLGTSFQTDDDVLEQILLRIPATLQLTFAAMLVSLLIAVPLGIFSAMRQNSLFDTISMMGATIGVSLPNFWFGLLLILFFALRLGWLPSYGIGRIDEGIMSVIKHLILPAITLGTALAAIVTRMTRSSMLEVVRQDYIRTARAKGLSERVVIYKHALKNALIPVVTVVGIQFGSLLGGAVVTETIFAWPGVGRLAVTAIMRRDFPMVQGNTLVLCALFVAVNLVVDIIYTFLDPRIAYD